MKSLVIFYTACIIVLYSALTYFGYRKEKTGDAKAGLQAEAAISATMFKTAESSLLIQHFDNACWHLKEKNEGK